MLSRVDPSTPAGRAAAANDVIYWMVQLENEVTREFYFDWLAKKLNVPLSSVEKVAERRLVDGARHSAATVRRDAGAVPPPKPRNASLERAVFELLVLMLDSEEYTRKALEDLPPDSLGDSVSGRAAEALLQSAMNGEWESAPPSILTSLEMEGADVSGFVEAIDLAAGRRAEREAVRDARGSGNAGEVHPSCPAADPVLCEKFFRNTYNSSMRLILSDYYTRKRAALVEQARGIPEDSPERAALVKQIGDISAELLKLPQKYRVVI